jgi:hypothetical protein
MTLLFIFLAAVFKSIADTLQHHYYNSVFERFNQNYWNPAISWKHVKFLPFTKYRPDAWHISNSLMIVSFLLAAAFNDLAWHPVVVVVALGLWYNLIFNLFYNKIWMQ